MRETIIEELNRIIVILERSLKILEISDKKSETEK